jgi:hypothetical protein
MANLDQDHGRTGTTSGLVPLEEETMRLALIALLLPLALAGCLSFSSSNPSPPASNTTVITPSH